METNDEQQKRNLMIEAIRRDLEFEANQRVEKPFRIMVIVKEIEFDGFCGSGIGEEILVCLN